MKSFVKHNKPTAKKRIGLGEKKQTSLHGANGNSVHHAGERGLRPIDPSECSAEIDSPSTPHATMG